MKANFMLSVANVKHLPPQLNPEIAFAGRSNVGKSTLINSILERKNLVKTGKVPGKTRLINFFNIGDKMTFVDLPGYGYAKVSKQERAQWAKLIESYFKHRQSLSMCFILIDIRRSIEDYEKELLEFLNHYHIAPCIVLTKSDKLSKNQLINSLHRHAREMGVDVKSLIHFSAITGDGKAEIRDKISETVGIPWK